MRGLYVVESDIVLLHIGCAEPPEDIVGAVVKRQGRYGRRGGGSPTLKCMDLRGNEFFAAQCWAVEILVRSPDYGRRTVNIFAQDRSRDGLRPVRRGIMEGSLGGLVKYYLGGLHRELTRPLDSGRMRRLFNKQKPGLVRRCPRGRLQVRIKTFRAWVRRNAERLLVPAARLEAFRPGCEGLGGWVAPELAISPTGSRMRQGFGGHDMIASKPAPSVYQPDPKRLVPGHDFRDPDEEDDSLGLGADDFYPRDMEFTD
ncbi:MAG TPA: hypothetical protein VMS31_06415 [Pyrinomonadaceae bacterium]|nr:hypothetical protein [Pyrinomonadaceae bacterium]